MGAAVGRALERGHRLERVQGLLRAGAVRAVGADRVREVGDADAPPGARDVLDRHRLLAELGADAGAAHDRGVEDVRIRDRERPFRPEDLDAGATVRDVEGDDERRGRAARVVDDARVVRGRLDGDLLPLERAAPDDALGQARARRGRDAAGWAEEAEQRRHV